MNHSPVKLGGLPEVAGGRFGVSGVLVKCRLEIGIAVGDQNATTRVSANVLERTINSTGSSRSFKA